MKFPIKLPEKATRLVGKALMKLKGVSPEVCVIGGVVCGGAALVMVGVRTWKGKDILAEDAKAVKDAKNVGTTTETQTQKDDITGEVKELECTTTRTLSEEEKRMIWAKRLDFGKDILKIYWIPGLLAVSSVGLIWGGRTMLRKELSAATAAYATLLETYRKYRERVAAEIGPEKEQELALGYKMVDVVDSETGKVEKLPQVNPQDNLSQYGFWFDEGYFDKESGEVAWRNYNHDRNKLVNRLLVKQIEDETTRQIRTVGYAWLEDVALKFGLDPEEARKFHDIGWVWKEGEDNRAEFGVLESQWQLPVNKGFCDDSCTQNKCFINPNVDGYIGYIRDDYKKYDFRYGYGKKGYKSIKREFNNVIQRYNEETMEKMVLGAMSPEGKRRMQRRILDEA